MHVYFIVCLFDYLYCIFSSLLKIDKYRNISSSGWDIFLNLFGDIPGMLVHLFWLVLNFLYVCQSVSGLTSLLKLDKFRDISGSVWDIFLNFSGNISVLLAFQLQIILNLLYVSQSVCWLTSLLTFLYTGIMPVLDDIFFWNFSEVFFGLWYTSSK